MRGRSESRKEAPAERRETGSSPGSEVRKNEVTIPSPLQLHPNTPSCSTSSPSTPIIIPGWGIPGESNSCLATELMFDCRLMQKNKNTKNKREVSSHLRLVRCNQRGSASLDGDRPASDRISLFVAPTRGHSTINPSIYYSSQMLLSSTFRPSFRAMSPTFKYD